MVQPNREILGAYIIHLEAIIIFPQLDHWPYQRLDRTCRSCRHPRLYSGYSARRRAQASCCQDVGVRLGSGLHFWTAYLAIKWLSLQRVHAVYCSQNSHGANDPTVTMLWLSCCCRACGARLGEAFSPRFWQHTDWRNISRSSDRGAFVISSMEARQGAASRQILKESTSGFFQHCSRLRLQNSVYGPCSLVRTSIFPSPTVVDATIPFLNSSKHITPVQIASPLHHLTSSRIWWPWKAHALAASPLDVVDAIIVSF